MKKYLVIGNPIEHSLSPKLHNHWFKQNNIDAIYENGIIYLYDNTADGANGCSQIIFDEIDKILDISRNLLSECNCHLKKDDSWDGCQKCTFTTSFCQTKNKNLSKKTAMGFFGLEF